MQTLLVAMLLAQTPASGDARYYALRKIAERHGMALVVGVDCDPPEGDWLSVRVNGPWHGWDRSCLILSKAEAGELSHVEDLTPAASAAEVKLKLSQPRLAPALVAPAPVQVEERRVIDETPQQWEPSRGSRFFRRVGGFFRRADSGGGSGASGAASC